MPRNRKIIRTIEVESCTLETASNEFFKYNKVKGLAVATQRTYKGYINGFVDWFGRERNVYDITTKVLDDFVIKKTDEGAKPISVATIMKHLRTFLNFCHKRGYMPEIEVIVPKFQVELKEPYTDDEMKLLLARPITDNWIEWRAWAMVNYFFSTGQRLSTVINIKIEHLDLDKRVVKLVHNKDKIQKYMPLSSAIVKVLQEYISLSELEEQDYLFPEIEGKQLKARSAEQAIELYNKSRGVKKTSIHLFRHTFAKNCICNGMNPVKLQKLLNHKDITMTMRYVNLYSDDISNDLDLFNPLDNFKRNNYIPKKRKRIVNKGGKYER